MARVLVTGMSGKGKSTVLSQLAKRDHHTVDTDDEGWSHESPTADGLSREHLWCEDRIASLLAAEPSRSLFVTGCATDQGSFYNRFDAVVLLSAPVDVLLERLTSRATNALGKAPARRRRILRDLTEVEPLLRATATVELDTRRPLGDIVEAIEELALPLRLTSAIDWQDQPPRGPEATPGPLIAAMAARTEAQLKVKVTPLP
ncbi:MAG: AAA family ATPase [Frankiaceae bacterium]